MALLRLLCLAGSLRQARPEPNPATTEPLLCSDRGDRHDPRGTALGWGTGGAAESPGKRTPLSVQNVSLYENGVSVCMVFCLVASLAKIHCTTHIVMIYSPLNA